MTIRKARKKNRFKTYEPQSFSNQQRRKNRRRICKTKKVYRDRAHAIVEATEIDTDQPLVPYCCPTCGKYHLTKKKVGARCD